MLIVKEASDIAVVAVAVAPVAVVAVAVVEG